jgi:hypothetical protein
VLVRLYAKYAVAAAAAEAPAAAVAGGGGWAAVAARGAEEASTAKQVRIAVWVKIEGAVATFVLRTAPSPMQSAPCTAVDRRVRGDLHMSCLTAAGLLAVQLVLGHASYL